MNQTESDNPKETLDNLSSGDIVKFNAHPEDHLCRVESMSARVGRPDTPKDVFKFEEIEGNATLVIFEEEFDEKITKRITGSDSQVAEALDRTEKDIRKRPTDLLIKWLDRTEDGDELYLIDYGHPGDTPVLWMWDGEDQVRYSDHQITGIEVWDSEDDCPEL